MGNRAIDVATKNISSRIKHENLFVREEGIHLPNREAIIEILDSLRRVMFPGYFGDENVRDVNPEYFVGDTLTHIYDELKVQVRAAVSFNVPITEDDCEACKKAETICDSFFGKLSYIQEMLLKDVTAGFDGDPAAKSKEEVIFSYPGLYAIFVYRIAHELYLLDVPFIPRIMTEHAHGLTGIDINSGATIGEYFFIDHGTGVVIGETTVIGNNVKLYQGVTLGALSTRSGQQLAGVKRHPTIGDNVTVYSNASILGGETEIGEDTVIGGNAFITESVPPHTRVAVKNPELKFKTPKKPDCHGIKWE